MMLTFPAVQYPVTNGCDMKSVVDADMLNLWSQTLHEPQKASFFGLIGDSFNASGPAVMTMTEVLID
jgi:hypothetical protein